MTEVWAKKGAEQGLVVHSMHPGWVATPGVEIPCLALKRMEHRLRDSDGLGYGCLAELRYETVAE